MHTTLFFALFVAAAGVSDAEVVGDWRGPRGLARITRDGGALALHLSLDGDELQSGKLEGTGATRKAGMNGCGATLVFKDAASLSITLDGPECPVELEGAYTKQPTKPATPATPTTPTTPASKKPGPAMQAWADLMAQGCDIKGAHIFTPFEARVIRNAGYAWVGFSFKNAALARFFAAEGHTPTGAAGLTEAIEKDCAEALLAHEKKLAATVPMSTELQDRLLLDPTNFDTFRGWSEGKEQSPYGRTKEQKQGVQIHWESSYPGCKAGQECGGYTVTCETETSCVSIAAG